MNWRPWELVSGSLFRMWQAYHHIVTRWIGLFLVPTWSTISMSIQYQRTCTKNISTRSTLSCQHPTLRAYMKLRWLSSWPVTTWMIRREIPQEWAWVGKAPQESGSRQHVYLRWRLLNEDRLCWGMWPQIELWSSIWPNTLPTLPGPIVIPGPCTAGMCVCSQQTAGKAPFRLGSWNLCSRAPRNAFTSPIQLLGTRYGPTNSPITCPVSLASQAINLTFFYREYPPYLPVPPFTGPQGTLWGLYPFSAKSICVCVGYCESFGTGYMRICG